MRTMKVECLAPPRDEPMRRRRALLMEAKVRQLEKTKCRMQALYEKRILESRAKVEHELRAEIRRRPSCAIVSVSEPGRPFACDELPREFVRGKKMTVALESQGVRYVFNCYADSTCEATGLRTPATVNALATEDDPCDE